MHSYLLRRSRRLIGFLAVVAMLAIVSSGCIQLKDGKLTFGSLKGSVSVTSTPDHAKITVDGKASTFQTPSTFDLTEGWHDIVLSKAGYTSESHHVQVVYQGSTDVTSTLNFNPDSFRIGLSAVDGGLVQTLTVAATGDVALGDITQVVWSTINASGVATPVATSLAPPFQLPVDESSISGYAIYQAIAYDSANHQAQAMLTISNALPSFGITLAAAPASPTLQQIAVTPVAGGVTLSGIAKVTYYTLDAGGVRTLVQEVSSSPFGLTVDTSAFSGSRTYVAVAADMHGRLTQSQVTIDGTLPDFSITLAALPKAPSVSQLSVTPTGVALSAIKQVAYFVAGAQGAETPVQVVTASPFKLAVNTSSFSGVVTYIAEATDIHNRVAQDTVVVTSSRGSLSLTLAATAVGGGYSLTATPQGTDASLVSSVTFYKQSSDGSLARFYSSASAPFVCPVPAAAVTGTSDFVAIATDGGSRSVEAQTVLTGIQTPLRIGLQDVTDDELAGTHRLVVVPTDPSTDTDIVEVIFYVLDPDTGVAAALGSAVTQPPFVYAIPGSMIGAPTVFVATAKDNFGRFTSAHVTVTPLG